MLIIFWIFIGFSFYFCLSDSAEEEDTTGGSISSLTCAKASTPEPFSRMKSPNAAREVYPESGLLTSDSELSQRSLRSHPEGSRRLSPSARVLGETRASRSAAWSAASACRSVGL